MGVSRNALNEVLHVGWKLGLLVMSKCLGPSRWSGMFHSSWWFQTATFLTVPFQKVSPRVIKQQSPLEVGSLTHDNFSVSMGEMWFPAHFPAALICAMSAWWMAEQNWTFVSLRDFLPYQNISGLESFTIFYFHKSAGISNILTLHNRFF